MPLMDVSNVAADSAKVVRNTRCVGALAKRTANAIATRPKASRKSTGKPPSRTKVAILVRMRGAVERDLSRSAIGRVPTAGPMAPDPDPEILKLLGRRDPRGFDLAYAEY